MPAPPLITPKPLAASLNWNTSPPVPPVRFSIPVKLSAPLTLPACTPLKAHVFATLAPTSVSTPVPPARFSNDVKSVLPTAPSSR